MSARAKTATAITLFIEVSHAHLINPITPRASGDIQRRWVIIALNGELKNWRHQLHSNKRPACSAARATAPR